MILKGNWFKFLGQTFLYTIVQMVVLGYIISSLLDNYQEISSHKQVIFIIIFVSLLLLNYILIRLLYNQFFQNNISDLYDKKDENKSSGEWSKSKELQVLILEDREKYRREFLGNVSHELKTPLFTIQGYISTLIDGAAKKPKIREKYLERINKSTERLIDIVQDLDMLMELEAGNIKLKPKNFNIIELCEEVFDSLDTIATKNKIQLKFDKTYKDPIMIKGDIKKLSQVLVNLIINGINYNNKDNGYVEVSFKIKKDNKVLIHVKDNGLGLSDKDKKRIFERFYRVDTHRSRGHGGSGLGLAIVKHILEAHNSKITVESKLNKGSIFKFELSTA